ncbi:fatty acyl-CoA reductase wat-like [Armigeres subalbatus]|uniref:fatty acyl-CoA reductase wat-like n=1 Tax=Armigeres subalbatus TaxID=124917 RepID=UPI002ED018D6
MGDLIKNCSENGLGAINLYKDSVVLISGGTGFIGKVLIEKLLRSFNVKKIYLLLREKQNVKFKTRLKEIFREPIFNVIRESHPDPASVFSKVIAVDTNFQNEKIISADDMKLLEAEVTIVFNVMASVKFNESIDSALDTNVVCSRKLFDIVSKMAQVRSVVHVSTFYSNCNRSRIEERIFEDIPFGGYSNLLEILSHLQENEKKCLTPSILGTMPNSYTFSKKCAEAMIQQSYAHLPICIFRPPVVTSAYREPIPGWVDNFNGISGMCVPMIQGKFYCCMAEREIASHTVPVDYCVAAMLAVGAERARTRGEATGTVPVFNYATDVNNIRWGDFGKWISKGCESLLGRLFGRYALVLTSSRFLRQMFVWWFILQAVAADLLLAFLGKKRQHLRTVKRLFALEDAARYFAMHGWTVQNDNMRRVMNRMNDEERNLLKLDIDRLDWDDYFKDFLPGVKAALARSYQRRLSRLGG